ncbi:MAG: SDR family NAD(P)-dependent oxidoreductase, partial [Longimicrobiales bacterium]
AWRARPRAPLRGRVALVTGGSRGLGFLIARELLREGARVAICARDEERLHAAVVRLEPLGEIAPFACDVGDHVCVEDMVRAIARGFGGIDIVVNNAATMLVGPLETMDVRDFRKALDDGFWGMVHTTLAALPFLRESRGRIANITSIGGKIPVPHLLPYCCAKFAAVGFSEGLAAELAGSGVSVTTVVPGVMRTGSPVNVIYRGRPEEEFAWFAAGDTLPFTSIRADRAAARIVTAISRRESEVTLGLQARALRVLHGLAPDVVLTAMGVANRLLPCAGVLPEQSVGSRLESTAPGVVRRSLAQAALATNQRATSGADADVGTKTGVARRRSRKRPIRTPTPTPTL